MLPFQAHDTGRWFNNKQFPVSLNANGTEADAVTLN
jgi:hypothetical protein